MSSSSHWENSHGAANDGAPRIGSNDLKPVSSNNSLQTPSPATTARRESPRGRSVWKPGTSDYLDGLRALPEVRPIPWVPGKELPPERSTASSRTQTRGAFLLSTRGVIRDPPCSHCATGSGRFANAVVGRLGAPQHRHIHGVDRGAGGRALARSAPFHSCLNAPVDATIAFFDVSE